jgi:hypothetical protein
MAAAMAQDDIRTRMENLQPLPPKLRERLGEACRDVKQRVEIPIMWKYR